MSTPEQLYEGIKNSSMLLEHPEVKHAIINLLISQENEFRNLFREILDSMDYLSVKTKILG